MHTPEGPASKNLNAPLDKRGQMLPRPLSIFLPAGNGGTLSKGLTYSPFLGIISVFALWLVGCRGIERNSSGVGGNDRPPVKDGETAVPPFKIPVGGGEIKVQGGETPLQVKLDSSPLKVEGAVELKANLADVLKGDAIPLRISGLDKPISIRLEGWPTKESPAEVHVSSPPGTHVDSEINKVVEDLKLQLQQTEGRLTNEIHSLKMGALPPENPNGRAVEAKLESIDQHLATLATLFQSAITLWKKGDVTTTGDSPLSSKNLEEIKSRLAEVKAELGPDGPLNRQVKDLTTRIKELKKKGKVEFISEIKPMDGQSIFYVIITIIAAGILGGLIAVYAIPSGRPSEQESKEQKPKLGWVRSFEAMAAAAFVPGLLFAIHSDLFEMADKYYSLVSLFSLCVIAATIGAPFIQFVHKKAAILMLRSERADEGLTEAGVSGRSETVVLDRITRALDSLPGPASRNPLLRLKAWVEFLTTYVPEVLAKRALEDLEEFVAEAVKESAQKATLGQIRDRLVDFENSAFPENKIMRPLLDKIIDRVIRPS